MNAGLLLVPLSLLASLTFLIERFYTPPTKVDDDELLENGYGFAGLVVFIVAVSILTLLVLSQIS